MPAAGRPNRGGRRRRAGRPLADGVGGPADRPARNRRLQRVEAALATGALWC